MKTYYFNITVETVQANSEQEAVTIVQALISQGQYEIELDDVDG